MRCSVEMQRGVSSVVQLLLLLGCLCAVATGYLFRTPLDLDVTPRVTVLNSGKDRHEHVLHLALKSSVLKFIPTFISELLEAVFCFLFFFNKFNNHAEYRLEN